MILTPAANTESKVKFFGGSLSPALGLRSVIKDLSGNASAALLKEVLFTTADNIIYTKVIRETKRQYSLHHISITLFLRTHWAYTHHNPDTLIFFCWHDTLDLSHWNSHHALIQVKILELGHVEMKLYLPIATTGRKKNANSNWETSGKSSKIPLHAPLLKYFQNCLILPAWRALWTNWPIYANSSSFFSRA